ncbi:MAG: hypothetical protein EA398_18045 [Deltaproteobacteria bacterium]|nr:MAG: hypothetical protein EA398_18045 [Deltaproteobacteria bacterium]
MRDLERFAAQHDADPAELQRRLIEAMILGAAADGRLDPRESAAMLDVIREQAEFAGIDGELATLSLSRAFEALVDEGFHVRLHALAASLPRYAHRALAFRCAVRVAMADGELHPDELSMLREMQRAFLLSDAEVERAFEQGRDDQASIIPDEVEPLDAFLDCLLMAAASNHVLADEERATLIAFILSRPEFDGVDPDQLNEYIRISLRAYSRGGIEGRLQTIADDLPLPVQRETAYGLAAAMVVADGDVDDRERHFLSSLRAALGLDEARAALVLEGVADHYSR